MVMKPLMQSKEGYEETQIQQLFVVACTNYQLAPRIC